MICRLYADQAACRYSSIIKRRLPFSQSLQAGRQFGQRRQFEDVGLIPMLVLRLFGGPIGEAVAGDVNARVPLGAYAEYGYVWPLWFKYAWAAST